MLSTMWVNDKSVTEAQNVISTFSLLFLYFYESRPQKEKPILFKIYYQLFLLLFFQFINI